MIKKGGFIDRLAKALYGRVVSSPNVHQSLDVSGRPPFQVIDRPEVLFPNLYNQQIMLGHLDWQWGDLVKESALIFLCMLARAGYNPIVEFGTFRGRTIYNLALNSLRSIVTIDIGHPTNEDANSQQRRYGEYVVGEVFLGAEKEIRDRIELIVVDSTKLDLSYLYGTVGMVIVDGGHSYEVCKSDSQKATKLVKPGGVIIWDDYGPSWSGVKQALDELAQDLKLYYFPREKLVLHIRLG